MNRIKVYTNELPIENIDLVTGLVQKQMLFVGSSKTEEQIRQAILQAFRPESRAVFFVGYDIDNTPVAFAFGNICVGLESGTNYFWLNELFVDMTCRRHGYASKLVSFIQNWLSDKEINYIACVTGEKNIAAQKVYEKSGFALNNIVWVDKKINL